MDSIGHIQHGVVVVQTKNDAEADITIIVHSSDERLTAILQDVSVHAVRYAVRSFDPLAWDVAREARAGHAHAG